MDGSFSDKTQNEKPVAQTTKLSSFEDKNNCVVRSLNSNPGSSFTSQPLSRIPQFIAKQAEGSISKISSGTKTHSGEF